MNASSLLSPRGGILRFREKGVGEIQDSGLTYLRSQKKRAPSQALSYASAILTLTPSPIIDHFTRSNQNWSRPPSMN